MSERRFTPDAELDDALFGGPCSIENAARFARILNSLLAALDREIVYTAILGESLTNLSNAEREEVDRVREFLHRRGIGVRTQPSDLRTRGLGVLNALADEFETSTAVHGTSPSARVAGSDSAPAAGSPAKNPPAAGGLSTHESEEA